jgi:hypothetical protein
MAPAVDLGTNNAFYSLHHYIFTCDNMKQGRIMSNPRRNINDYLDTLENIPTFSLHMNPVLAPIEFANYSTLSSKSDSQTRPHPRSISCAAFLHRLHTCLCRKAGGADYQHYRQRTTTCRTEGTSQLHLE